MNSSAAISTLNINANEETATARVVELLTAAWENRGNDVLRILEADPQLLQLGDPVGDTALHVVARAGHVYALRQMIEFLQSNHPELLKTVAKQMNGHGDTPFHLTIKNRHKKAALLLFDVEPKVASIANENGEFPYELAEDDKGDLYDKYMDSLFMEEQQLLKLCSDKEYALGMIKDTDKLDCKYEKCLTQICLENLPVARLTYASLTSDIELDIRTPRSPDFEGKILDILEANLNLIHLKNAIGNTILHEAAYSGNIDMLTKLIGKLMTSRPTSCDSREDHLKLPRLNLLLEGNNDGNTALHQTLLNKHSLAALYLTEVAPEAAYQVNNEGKSPLCLALESGYDDLVKYVLQVLPVASISPVRRPTLLTSNKGSLPHAAIRARNLNMLELILESLPRLIDFSDEKGWKPLSYAAYKGYLAGVQFLLNKFPQSVKEFDADGSLPIHKAISGGHISIFKEFISSHPETLYAIDKKGRSILHIAVRYAKADILSYLIHDTNDIQKIFDIRDHEGKTFVDLAKELQRN